VRLGLLDHQHVLSPTLLFYLGGILAYAGPKGAADLAENRLFFFGLTVGLLWLTAVLNIRGIGVGKWVNNSGGWGTLIGTVVLVMLAGAAVWRHGFALHASAFAIRGLDWSIMSSFGVICFGLVGLELGPVMGDEIRDPQRSVPRGVLWGGNLAGLGLPQCHACAAAIGASTGGEGSSRRAAGGRQDHFNRRGTALDPDRVGGLCWRWLSPAPPPRGSADPPALSSSPALTVTCRRRSVRCIPSSLPRTLPY